MGSEPIAHRRVPLELQAAAYHARQRSVHALVRCALHRSVAVSGLSRWWSMLGAQSAEASRHAAPLDHDELQVFMVVADSARPVHIDQLARIFWDRVLEIAAIVERLRQQGLVEMRRTSFGVLVAATEWGRSKRKRL